MKSMEKKSPPRMMPRQQMAAFCSSKTARMDFRQRPEARRGCLSEEKAGHPQRQVLGPFPDCPGYVFAFGQLMCLRLCAPVCVCLCVCVCVAWKFKATETSYRRCRVLTEAVNGNTWAVPCTMQSGNAEHHADKHVLGHFAETVLSHAPAYTLLHPNYKAE